MPRKSKQSKLNSWNDLKASTAKDLEASSHDATKKPAPEAKTVPAVEEQKTATVAADSQQLQQPSEARKAPENPLVKLLEALDPKPKENLDFDKPKENLDFDKQWAKVVSEVKENHKRTIELSDRLRERNRILGRKIAELHESLARSAAKNKNATKENQ
ncbi:hypothetical protein TWF718_002199 [Orbilia javanica]|uniref:Uncharacterized protein n=1 Tax=Orbilia javanica TaxID=47235 RepID=A0AAN8R8K0_9PEZI